MKRKTRRTIYRAPQFHDGGPHISLAPPIEEKIRIEIDSSDDRNDGDDQFLRYVLAAGVLVIGVIVAIPAIMQWSLFLNSEDPSPIGRWVWLLAFVGGLHVLYAIYAATVDDYGSYRSMAVFFLISACLMGFFGVSLWLGSSTGVISRFLQISALNQPRGAAWCGAMAGLSVLASYVFSRETIFARDRHNLRCGKEKSVA
jgi:hypothetical protein